MSTRMDKEYFNYDGKSSRDFGVISVNLGNDMLEESILGSRTISEDVMYGNNNPNLKSIETAPKEIPMIIAFEDGFKDGREVNRVMQWLFQDMYKPLFFEESLDKIYYCIPVGDAALVHNGLRQGYVKINMRCNSPYVYSQYHISDLYDLSSDNSGTILTIENHGDYDLFPEISIRKIGDGNIEFENISNDGYIYEVLKLINEEEIYINSEKEIIETNLLGIYRYDNVVGRRIKLGYGINHIKVTGNCFLQFRYQYKFMF